ncbi:MAG: DNA repair protein RecN [Bacteroidota bacterium]
MLLSLHIRNYAIIKAVDISFDQRLNIITGETGAGKSILMGALGLILGERADSKVLHNPEDKCVVEGNFGITDYNLQSFFETHELDYDTTCIIRREIAPNGKSRAFVNDTPVNLTVLKDLGEQLIDIVSQHQTMELNEEQFQLSVVDAIAETDAQLNAYIQIYKKFKRTEKELKELVDQEAKARTDEDYFKFVLNELNEANLQADEQVELEKQLEILSHAEQIQQAAGNAARVLDADELSIIDQIQQLRALLQPAAKHHPGLHELLKRLDSVSIELKDISTEIEAVSEQSQADPESLVRTEERLQLLFNLQKKHRAANNEELLTLQRKLETDLTSIGSLQNEIADKQVELTQLTEKLSKEGKALSDKRAKSIPDTEKKIHELLKQVEMPDAHIQIENNPIEGFSATGMDKIQLLFAANKGQSFQPISKVASGGELSRLMLCIKSLIADKVALPSIVFDEIDTGISGEAALKVSQVMKQHSKHHQVIAITHLPQIAGKADAHFFVHKTTDKTSTHTHIKLLSENERLEEIARMLHGANPSPKVLEAARELIG